MTEINKLIEETERLLAAATPGPWGVEKYDDPSRLNVLVTGPRATWKAQEVYPPDAALMAAAPTALRALVDEVYRLRRQVAQLEFDATTQPNADWQPNSKTVAAATPPKSQIRTCSQCRHFAVTSDGDDHGEHHPACEHAPANPRNAGPRYRSPAMYEGNAGDSEPDPV